MPPIQTPDPVPMIYVDRVTGIPCPTSAQWPACADERLSHDHRLVPGDTPPELHPDTGRVLLDVEGKREAQVAKGHTRELDDEHGPDHLVELAEPLLASWVVSVTDEQRDMLIELAALIVAAVEVLDRAEAGS